MSPSKEDLVDPHRRSADLEASRARILAAADESRRRLHRELHDGAQQRLVHAVIALKLARSAVEPGSTAAALVEEALSNAERASSELRDVVRSILPSPLVYGGLRVGLESLVADLGVPAELRCATPRLPPAVETTAYLVVTEALTNTVAHARARRVEVEVGLVGDTLVLEVRDDGVGGADTAAGTGLTGLRDRVEAAAGTWTLLSPQGRGTTVRATLPVRPGTDADTQR